MNFVYEIYAQNAVGCTAIPQIIKITFFLYLSVVINSTQKGVFMEKNLDYFFE